MYLSRLSNHFLFILLLILYLNQLSQYFLHLLLHLFILQSQLLILLNVFAHLYQFSFFLLHLLSHLLNDAVFLLWLLIYFFLLAGWGLDFIGVLGDWLRGWELSGGGYLLLFMTINHLLSLILWRIPIHRQRLVIIGTIPRRHHLQLLLTLLILISSNRWLIATNPHILTKILPYIPIPDILITFIYRFIIMDLETW